jgi:hypothetical protein
MPFSSYYEYMPTALTRVRQLVRLLRFETVATPRRSLVLDRSSAQCTSIVYGVLDT